ncbi:unnamed protein product [Rotaria magnacalcarata]|uniref:Uncharacterized protein n=2 Tax=Rotaria magnacalcarata TaxID=392030 RepID=A0A816U679_9BILA|nr:unnamed protein product [Rotaria magnacalcarata]
MFFEKLLYVGVHKRLNRIAQDSVFTNNLTLLISSSNGFVYSLPDPILDRFFSHILPKIHQKIKWLGLESLSIERILRATNYPNLYGISLYNIQAETAIGLFTDETSLICTLKNQILELVIDISTNKIQSLPVDDNTIIFTHIFTTFTNLQYLNFGPSLLYHQRLSFSTSPLTIISTNLLKLHVYLENFNDCLYLLDGRFNQLHTLSANISFISASPLTINNKEKMPTLKCFSLHCDIETCAYDELILPLFRRMLNLEKLNLCLIVGDRKTFFDGNDLKINIINHMSRLNYFTFNIRSSSRFYNQINLPSNENIQNTFRDFCNKQIIYCADYFSTDKKGHCHIYSYPYKLNYYDDITNNFPGGIFKYVRKVSLFDEHPFEHEFFLRIAQSFPLMEKLCVCNEKRQINKQFRKSKNENQDLSIIKYPYLKELDLIHSCIDYHAQFLLDTKTCLPFDVRVSMQYELLKKVTRNFRRNTTRSNCAKMNCVYLCTKVEFSGYFDNFSPRKPQFPEHIKDYFPRAKIH